MCMKERFSYFCFLKIIFYRIQKTRNSPWSKRVTGTSLFKQTEQFPAYFGKPLLTQGCADRRGPRRWPWVAARFTRVIFCDQITLWAPIISGKQPRKPLYSWLHSMRKWRSFFGCNKTQIWLLLAEKSRQRRTRKQPYLRAVSAKPPGSSYYGQGLCIQPSFPVRKQPSKAITLSVVDWRENDRTSDNF